LAKLELKDTDAFPVRNEFFEIHILSNLAGKINKSILLPNSTLEIANDNY